MSKFPTISGRRRAANGASSDRAVLGNSVLLKIDSWRLILESRALREQAGKLRGKALVLP